MSKNHKNITKLMVTVYVTEREIHAYQKTDHHFINDTC